MKEVTIQTYNKLFWDMVNDYDTTNPNILRKIIHCFSVAEKCFALASHMGLDKHNREFCYLIGLLHDIGRFEQWKVYETFDDNKSVSHAELGVTMLSKLKCSHFDLTKSEFKLLLSAVKWHTRPYIGKDKNIKFYVSIIKNADTFANIITSANGAQPMTVKGNGVTNKIIEDFKKCKPLWDYSPNTKLDRALMVMALCYYLESPYFREQVISNNYIDLIFETFSQYLNKKDKLIYSDAVKTLKKNYAKKVVSY